MPIVTNYTALLSGDTLNQVSVTPGTAVSPRPAFVTYSFNATRPEDDDDDTPSPALDPSERELFRQAINQWAAASGLVAFETKIQGDIDIYVAPLQVAGQGTFPQSMLYMDDGRVRVYAGDEQVGAIVIDPEYTSDAHVLIHEIGHTLGLKHPHDGSLRLSQETDNGDNTVMSYKLPYSDDLGPFDIAAIQALYGQNSADGTQVTAWNWNPQTETLTQVGNGGDEVLVGTGANDVIDSAGGRDAIVTKGGNDTVTVHGAGIQANLGTGFDTVIVDYARDQIAFIETDDVGTYFHDVSDSDDDTSYFFGVERFDFGNEILALDLDGNAGQAYRLYQAAYDRTPDRAGVSFWTEVLDIGHSLQFVADHFVTADEFVEKYGANPTDVQYIDLLYSNVLDRMPDAAGYDFWVDKMVEEGLTRADLLIEFSESDENQDKVFPQVHEGIWLDDIILA